jgi:hypothetical protein
MILPVWITNLPRVQDWDYHYQDLVKQHKSYQYDISETWSWNNFSIDDPTGIWDQLYQNFLKKCEELFGPLVVHDNNSRKCWLYPTNKDHYLGGIHNHTTTCMINGVYYFSVPESTYYDGTISFYDGSNTNIWKYKPRECDLIIFPGFLNHEPNRIKTQEYRLAINMEIKCDWPASWGETQIKRTF